jgi:hypothetical protein
MAPLLPRFKAGAGAGFTGALGLSGFLFLSNALDALDLAAPGLAAATFEAFGAVLRRSDFVVIEPPDARGGI